MTGTLYVERQRIKITFALSEEQDQSQNSHEKWQYVPMTQAYNLLKYVTFI
jgi:hypothetical protein